MQNERVQREMVDIAQLQVEVVGQPASCGQQKRECKTLQWPRDERSRRAVIAVGRGMKIGEHAAGQNRWNGQPAPMLHDAVK
ncbi:MULTISPECIES: hypothetical protein [unclassified Paraburkholderia]|uniref:hypothetical protein n=1 Tax=unclassified Paraburkholderia TaxID=2615204 RepID=UPI001616C6C2|nr:MULTISPECIES: hypothetical protein [unclassified Paraburkholderia]MBB5447438.1 hypothetical protein [Paraburkholderia sp. WSM4177]MBB5487908.1 hypothetical protein [Paraburkholderia sp. WSM4180]